MRPMDVITAVRDRLGDSKRERWSNEALVLYVSMCQADICMHANLYKRSTNISLQAETLIYQLPTDFLALNRLEYTDKLFPVETRNNIDHGDATFPCALKDNLMYNELEIRLGDSYETLTEALTNVYGVVTQGTEADAIEGSVYGVVVEADNRGFVPPSQDLDSLLVYYTAVPPLLTITDLLKPLIVPDAWFGAFLHFVCGMALQDDNDANNIERGELENAKYSRQLANIMKTMAKDSTSNIRTKLVTKVRRI